MQAHPVDGAQVDIPSGGDALQVGPEEGPARIAIVDDDLPRATSPLRRATSTLTETRLILNNLVPRAYSMTPPWMDSLDATNCDHSPSSCLNSGVARA